MPSEPILLDSREPKSFRILMTAAGLDYRIVALHEADFMLTDREGRTMGLERKAIRDFLASIPKRVGDQIKRCSTVYTTFALVLEGHWGISRDGKVTIAGRRTGWTAVAMWGKLMSLQCENRGLVILTTPDQAGTIALVAMLQKRGSLRGFC